MYTKNPFHEHGLKSIFIYFKWNNEIKFITPHPFQHMDLHLHVTIKSQCGIQQRRQTDVPKRIILIEQKKIKTLGKTPSFTNTIQNFALSRTCSHYILTLSLSRGGGVTWCDQTYHKTYAQRFQNKMQSWKSASFSSAGVKLLHLFNVVGSVFKELFLRILCFATFSQE